MSDSHKKRSGPAKVEIVHVHIEHSVEEPAIPLYIKSKFKNFKDWLVNICESDEPNKSISEFNINYFESEGKYTLYLFGVNTYQEGKNRYVTRIEFEPVNMYFKLSPREYKNFNRHQLQEILTTKVRDFTNTEIFKTSFLAKADVVMGFSGEKIWQQG